MELVPQVVDSSTLDSVVYIAAGRYHTVAIRKVTEGDKPDVEEEKDDSCIPSSAGVQDPENQVVTIDIQHEVFTWGRGYHGQLGLRDVKNVQWVPKKVRIKKDPRLQDEDQPNRFHMVSCG